jgi:hypothetical protein
LEEVAYTAPHEGTAYTSPAHSTHTAPAAAEEEEEEEGYDDDFED